MGASKVPVPQGYYSWRGGKENGGRVWVPFLKPIKSARQKTAPKAQDTKTAKGKNR